jgi:hypothetical protein
MGNFSRHTFDPLKNYVGVRLQQGVPVLDADWNELNDVTRQELYDTLSFTFTDGIPPGGSDFQVLSRSEPSNDFDILAGTALIQGRPIRLRNNVRYSTQPWTDPQRAARDGVAVIPPLTIPPGPPEGAPPRTDIVYLDVWDREVDSFEDTNLINPAIGVETCVRLKREAAVRVAEETRTLPTAPAGHAFLPLALLHRPRNQPEIIPSHIESIRPYFHSPQGTGVVSFFPAFLPIQASPDSTQTLPAWRIGLSPNGSGGSIAKFRAVKTQNEIASGILPLILPDRARLISFAIRGDISAINGVVQWLLMRFRHQVPTAADAEPSFETLHEDSIWATSAGYVFNMTYYDLSADKAKLTVDNSRYYYALVAYTGIVAGGYTASIHGVSISYEYYGLAGPPTTSTTNEGV